MNNFVLEYFLFVYFSHILYMHENLQNILFVAINHTEYFPFFVIGSCLIGFTTFSKRV